MTKIELHLSDKERKLFAALHAQHYTNLVENKMWTVHNLYSIIGQHAFLHGFNCNDEPGASLARVIHAWQAMKPMRRTVEFDDLINL